MPPRRSRAAKQSDADVAAETVEPSTSTTSPSDPAKVKETSATTSAPTKPKAKSRAARHQPLVPEAASVEPDPLTASPAASPEAPEAPETPVEPEPAASSTKPTMEDRQARLSALRAKMAASTRANRCDILSEQSRTRAIASDLKNASGSRKLQKAEKVLEERDLRESGEDVERHRNMNYSLEDSERWDAKLEEKERRKDQGPGDFGDAAERAYQRQLRSLKPDVSAYKKQRDQAEAIKASSPASALVVRGKGKGRSTDSEATDELHYGTHRPSDDAIDRVVNHLNHEKQLIQNRSRRRNEDADAEVNYINDSNRHFNKKLKRFYDKQTQEIRENLERGTAL
ncbi:related to SYF2-pre-mRNA-splicing factor [Sporisorium scitamineum]|uniref:Pre-mRNA-splicing factor SYF2 n=3 Tax=Sporisorium scitamineum TaxID=49012 RepID=A0A127ZCY7_9BASI|nr:related to SYF2-pre-mRNA-splicing factor [Sporisorium scitamineum]